MAVFIRDFFDKAPSQLLHPLNSVSWELGTLSDRLGLASDLWHHLGRCIVPCCVSPSHSKKKKKERKCIINSMSSFKVSLVSGDLCSLPRPHLAKLLSFSNSKRCYLSHALWTRTQASAEHESQVHPSPKLELKLGDTFELQFPVVE